MTVKYLRDTKGVHNLLYAFSPADVNTEAEYLLRYPGDEWVDIVGFDTYAFGTEAKDIEGYQKKIRENLLIVTKYAAKADKIPVLAETGMALKDAGRPIVFSLCEWGDNKPWLWAEKVGHLWRTTGDIYNCYDCIKDNGSWKAWGVMQIVDKQEGLRKYAGPGHWNDPDMLEVGNGMSVNEERAHFTMWAMGKKAGDEVVQLYISDKVSSAARPVKELKDFARVSLQPGQTKTVTFTVTPDKLEYYNADLEKVIEPGTFEALVGSDSETLKGVSFEVTK